MIPITRSTTNAAMRPAVCVYHDAPLHCPTRPAMLEALCSLIARWMMCCCRAACPTLWLTGCWETCRRRPAGTWGKPCKHQSAVCGEGEERGGGTGRKARAAGECLPECCWDGPAHGLQLVPGLDASAELVTSGMALWRLSKAHNLLWHAPFDVVR